MNNQKITIYHDLNEDKYIAIDNTNGTNQEIVNRNGESINKFKSIYTGKLNY